MLDRTEEGTRARPSLPLWVREPVVLARFPGVLAAVIGASLVLALIGGAGPLFSSSVANASLREALRRAPQSALTVVAYGPVTGGFVRSPSDELRRETSGFPGTSSPRLSIVATPLAVSSGVAVAQVTPIGMDRFEAHLGGAQGGGDGLWIDRATAGALGVSTGDMVTLRTPSGSTTATVAAVFDSVASRRSSFWAPVSQVVGGAPSGPPPMFVSSATFVDLLSRVGGSGRFEWDLPLRTLDLSLAQAESLAARLQVVRHDVQDPHTTLGASFHTDRYGIAAPYVSTRLPALVSRANGISAATKGPIDTVSLAGRLLALFGLGAAGTYGVRRRRVEAALLGARGAGPLVQGARAALEAVLPVAAGGAAGFAIALWMVRVVGPSTFVDRAARSSAEATTIWTLVVALALLGLASGLAARTELEEASPRARRVLSRAPWEAAVLILGVASLYEVLSRKGVASGPTPHVDRLLVLFPVLFIAGVAGVLVRLLGRWLARLRSVGSRWRPGAYLAMRRVSATPRLALLLVAGTSLAFGILVFAGTVSHSVRSSADEKAFVRVGADVAVPLAAAKQPAVPSSTVVVDYSGHATAGGGSILVHAIDPATFARAAYWHSAFGASSADDVLAKVRISGGSLVPIAVAGSGVQSRDVLEIAGSHIPVRVVSRLAALPGMPGGGVAVVLVSRSAFASRALLSQGAPTLWARGDEAAILADLRRPGLSTRGAVSAASLARTPSFLAISWTFDFLEAIGAITALVAVLGLLLYLQARQRDRDVSYALASRMGLSARAHAVSVLVEILAMMVAAFVIGVGLAVAAARLVLGKLDVLPGAPPPPRFRVPLSLVGLIAAAIVILAVIGAAAVQRRAGRAHVSEVLRLAG